MLPSASVVDWAALRDVIIAAFVAGVGVTASFAIAILGATRFSDYRRDGRVAAATTFAVVAVLALGACAAALVFGIIVMTQK